MYLFSSGLDVLFKDSHALEKMAEAFPDMFSEIIQNKVVFQRLKIIGNFQYWQCSCIIYTGAHEIYYCSGSGSFVVDWKIQTHIARHSCQNHLLKQNDALC